jgi:hypothetical protein
MKAGAQIHDLAAQQVDQPGIELEVRICAATAASTRPRCTGSRFHQPETAPAAAAAARSTSALSPSDISWTATSVPGRMEVIQFPAAESTSAPLIQCP